MSVLDFLTMIMEVVESRTKTEIKQEIADLKKKLKYRYVTGVSEFIWLSTE